MNITIHSKKSPSLIKLIDFGVSVMQKSKESIMCGTPGYLAPELFDNNRYSQKSDIYSCGIVLYFILSGESPFPGRNSREILAYNKKNHIKFTSSIFGRVSEEAKNFIKELTNINPDIRPTASEALENSWLRKNSRLEAKSFSFEDPDSYDYLTQFSAFTFKEIAECSGKQLKKKPGSCNLIVPSKFEAEKSDQTYDSLSETEDKKKNLSKNSSIEFSAKTSEVYCIKIWLDTEIEKENAKKILLLPFARRGII